MGAFKYKSKEFMLTVYYILYFNHDETGVYICIKYKLYLIKALKANILIGNAIFYIKDFLINFVSAFAYIQSYNINIIINAKYYA